MSRPPQYQQGNIIRSVTYAIGDSIVVNAVVVPVLHNDSWSDPETIREPAVAPDPVWVSTTWLETMAGRQGANVLQVDVFSRVGAPGTAHHDPFGLFANAVMDEIEALFAGLAPGGGAMFWLPVLDFTDPDLPTDTGGCLVMQTVDGRPGMPQDRNYLGVQNGFHRIVARLRFLLVRDMIRGAAFMTE